MIINDLYGYENYEFLEDVSSFVLNKLEIKDKEFSVIFVDKDEIKEINKNYRNIDKVTDVISFAFNDEDSFMTDLLGEIYICIPIMQEQAIEYCHSEKRELSFLLVHGILHLLGYDHVQKDEEKVMFNLQEEILNELNILR